MFKEILKKLPAKKSFKVEATIQVPQEGELELPHRYKYSGKFYKALPHGEGKKTNDSNILVWEGIWKNGAEYTGRGRVFKDGELLCDGEMIEGKLHTG